MRRRVTFGVLQTSHIKHNPTHWVLAPYNHTLTHHDSTTPPTLITGSQSARALAKAAKKDEYMQSPIVALEAANYRTDFQAIITVSGQNVETFTQPKLLASFISQDTNAMLRTKYGNAFQCNYNVSANIAPFAGKCPLIPCPEHGHE